MSPPWLVVVGSRNPVKVNAVRLAFEKVFGDNQTLEVVGVNAPSGVSDQPSSDQETRQGAINRARNALSAYSSESKSVDAATPKFCVGVEGGVSSARFQDDHNAGANTLFCSAWMAVYSPSDDKWGISQSGGFPLPSAIVKLMDEGMELGEADDALFGRVNSKQSDGTVGALTKGLVNRTDYYEHALTLALVPFMNPTLY